MYIHMYTRISVTIIDLASRTRITHAALHYSRYSRFLASVIYRWPEALKTYVTPCVLLRIHACAAILSSVLAFLYQHFPWQSNDAAHSLLLAQSSSCTSVCVFCPILDSCSGKDSSCRSFRLHFLYDELRNDETRLSATRRREKIISVVAFCFSASRYLVTID